LRRPLRFEEDLVIVDPFNSSPVPLPEDDETEAAYRALGVGNARLRPQVRIQQSGHRPQRRH
jgi:hypothetical protein